MTSYLKLISVASLALVACASGPEASRQAGEGAKYGAIGGAVAGAVSAAIFGGSIAEGAAAGALTGAASGAAVGAAAGSAADKAAAAPSQPDPKVAALRQRIGDRNYSSALLLAQCRHKEAIASAEETYAASQDRDQRIYALAIQGVAAEESGDKALATSVYPRIQKEDPSRGSEEKLRADALQAVLKVQAARRQAGLPPTCS